MQHLYRIYDNQDRLLYVGISSNLGARLKQHSKTKDWWDEVSAIRLSHYRTRRQVLDAEERAIKRESPKWNVVHNAERAGKWIPRQRENDLLEYMREVLELLQKIDDDPWFKVFYLVQGLLPRRASSDHVERHR